MPSYKKLGRGHARTPSQPLMVPLIDELGMKALDDPTLARILVDETRRGRPERAENELRGLSFYKSIVVAKTT
jgi:hypothetical protein